jgi:peptidoglycan/LPS O-acetylase OafA/YrhL
MVSLGFGERALGLIRVLLAMAVLFGHLPILDVHIIGAALAVQAFFIVSGFYMALVLSGKYSGQASLFYSNRLLRLMPTYFVMCGLYAVALWGFNASATADPQTFARAFSNPITAIVMAFENIAIVGQELLFWFTLGPHGELVFNSSGAAPNPPDLLLGWQALLVPQSWSLSMELMFYALAPFLARLNWRWLAAIAAASIVLRLAGYLLPVNYPIWQGRFFPTALFLFVFGMLAHKMLPQASRLPKAVGWAVNIALLALMIALQLVVQALQLTPEWARWGMYVLIALAIPFVFNAFKDFVWDRWIGDLSYPLYLVHLLVIGAVLTFIPNAPYAAWMAIGGSLVLSALTLVLIDHPIDRWRQRRAEKAAAKAEPVLPPEASVAPL